MQNHMEKVLEDANLKLGCVVTDTPLGVSEQNIIRAVIAGDKDPGWMADLARGTLSGKRKELEQSLHGCWRRYRLSTRLWNGTSNVWRHQELVDRLNEIPGFGPVTAWTVIAELGGRPVSTRAFGVCTRAHPQIYLAPPNSRKRPAILLRARGRCAQRLRRVQRPIWIAQKLARQQH